MTSGKMDDFIWGCRHKLKGSKYTCTHFIDKKSKYLSDNFEPVDEQVGFFIILIIKQK